MRLHSFTARPTAPLPSAVHTRASRPHSIAAGTATPPPSAWQRTREGDFEWLRVCIDVEPSCLVGQRVKVLWDGERQVFAGTIKSFDEAEFTHKVEYDDGDCAAEFLALEQAMLMRVPPTPTTLRDAGRGSSSSGGGGEGVTSGIGGGGGAHAWPAPSSSQLIALGVLLTQRVDAVEKEASGNKSAGTARARSNAGGPKAKALRTLIKEVMALADAKEAEEQREGAQGSGRPGASAGAATVRDTAGMGARTRVWPSYAKSTMPLDVKNGDAKPVVSDEVVASVAQAGEEGGAEATQVEGAGGATRANTTAGKAEVAIKVTGRGAAKAMQGRAVEAAGGAAAAAPAQEGAKTRAGARATVASKGGGAEEASGAVAAAAAQEGAKTRAGTRAKPGGRATSASLAGAPEPSGEGASVQGVVPTGGNARCAGRTTAGASATVAAPSPVTQQPKLLSSSRATAAQKKARTGAEAKELWKAQQQLQQAERAQQAQRAQQTQQTQQVQQAERAQQVQQAQHEKQEKAQKAQQVQQAQQAERAQQAEQVQQTQQAERAQQAQQAQQVQQAEQVQQVQQTQQTQQAQQAERAQQAQKAQQEQQAQQAEQVQQVEQADTAAPLSLADAVMTAGAGTTTGGSTAGGAPAAPSGAAACTGAAAAAAAVAVPGESFYCAPPLGGAGVGGRALTPCSEQMTLELAMRGGDTRVGGGGGCGACDADADVDVASSGYASAEGGGGSLDGSWGGGGGVGCATEGVGGGGEVTAPGSSSKKRKPSVQPMVWDAATSKYSRKRGRPTQAAMGAPLQYYEGGPLHGTALPDAAVPPNPRQRQAANKQQQLMCNTHQHQLADAASPLSLADALMAAGVALPGMDGLGLGQLPGVACVDAPLPPPLPSVDGGGGFGVAVAVGGGSEIGDSPPKVLPTTRLLQLFHLSIARPAGCDALPEHSVGEGANGGGKGDEAGGGGARGGGAGGSGEDDRGRVGSGADGGAGGGVRLLRSSAQGAPDACNEVVDNTFGFAPHVLAFVAGPPHPAAAASAQLLSAFHHWGNRLNSVVSDVPLPHMPPGSQLVSITEATEILEWLKVQAVSLELLEQTKVCKAVAMLRSHRNLRVAQAAVALAHQDVSNTALAVAKLGHLDAAFMVALARVAQPQLGTFTPQALTNTAWALAKLGHQDPTFMGELLVVAEPQLGTFTPQNLSNLAWALATLGHVNAAFMRALVQAAKRQLSRFTPQGLANMAWALATLGQMDAAFMSALAEVATPQLGRFTEQGLANTAWALATLGCHDAAFTDAQVQAAKLQLGSCTSQALANTAWALATRGHKDTAFMHVLLQAAKLQLHRFTPQVVANMAWALAALDEQKAELAVEVDGPYHFLSNAPTVPNGATRLRSRLLEARGWHVVSVPVKEWYLYLAKGQQAAGDYLTSLVVCASASHGAPADMTQQQQQQQQQHRVTGLSGLLRPPPTITNAPSLLSL
ncbi:hypothetical protein FOA52_000958 [Chlamydomonas sp. UWO 241]|nr:hypothetical protein FOA52_000958 [Chlamydomonas sp. UWO 241]